MVEQELKIYVDKRELKSTVPFFLKERGVRVLEKTLTVGDYIISEDVAVERKNVRELASSIYSNRLFDECERLKETYPLPVLLIEGYLPILFRMSGIRETSVWGAFSSVLLDLKISIIPTPNPKSTALMLERMAYREQVQKEKQVVIRPKRKQLGLAEQQLFFLCGLPNVGYKLADSLLRKFKTPYQVIKSLNEAEIVRSKSGKTMKIDGDVREVRNLGPKKTLLIQEVLNTEYSP